MVGATMSDALYERYKDALRRGHVSSMRGNPAAAVEAYAEAARIAPDRPLPLVGMGTVLVAMGKPAEALTAFDAALDRAPADEGALRGRADVLMSRGDRLAAADALDRLASALDAAGRLPDATDAARRALELAESRSRRRSVTSLVERLRASGDDPAAAEAMRLALEVLEGRALDMGDGGPVEPPLEAVPPPFDPAAATAEVEAAAAAGDVETTVARALAAAAGHRAAGSTSAAIDACYLALGLSPTDPGLHLTLAELYLDRGWRPLAVDKLLLLRRLADLVDDGATLEAIAALAAARLPDDPRLVAAQV
jgi:tetratricopeptide (TPR) repeat protein